MNFVKKEYIYDLQKEHIHYFVCVFLHNNEKDKGRLLILPS